MPLSKGKVSLDSTIVGYPALIGLTEFSHVWLLFVFHENTNAIVNGVTEDRPTRANAEGARSSGSSAPTGAYANAAKEAEQSENGSRGVQSPGRRPRPTFLTKVMPPRLGKKVGVFGTRSPHRPNPIGLTMVKLEDVDLKTNSISVSGVDLVDGTPIIDVKPVIPHDVPAQMKTPEWVDEDPCLRRVVFEIEADRGLEGCLGEAARKKKSKFYHDVDSFKAALTEVLVQDVRSVHQGRGLASNELYECYFDGVVVHFFTTVDEINVVSAE